jgi:uncharacterized protein YceK
MLLTPLSMIDFFPSLVMDTLLLPYTATRRVEDDHKEEMQPRTND